MAKTLVRLLFRGLFVIGTAAVFIMAMGAQTAKPATAPMKPPVLTDAQKAAFFKAQAQTLQAGAEAQRAQQVAQQKAAALQAVIAEVSKACGDKYQPSLDNTGDLVCVVKPGKHAEAPKGGK